MPRDTMLPHSIRFSINEWAAFTDAAIKHAQGQVTTYVRDCAIAGHSFLAAQRALRNTDVLPRITARNSHARQFRAS